MKIQQSQEMQNNPISVQNNTEEKIRKTDKKTTVINSVSGAVLKGESLIQQRQGFAKKQALKVVSDAFAGEKKLDAQMQSIKDEIKRLQDEINEKRATKRENNEKLKELQEEYGIDPDSEENRKLAIYAGKVNHSKDGLSDEEREALSEYQQKALFYYASNQDFEIEIANLKARQAANVQGYFDMKTERNKSQDMLNAQDAAEDILDASNNETIALLTEEAVEHVDEEQKEREEEAREAAEKKKEEKKEEAKKLEKEAMQQEMMEHIKEHASDSQRTSADIKRAIARRERAEAERMDVSEIQKTVISDGTSIEDTQEAVNLEITNILNKLSLLSNDVKGTTIDDQI